MQDKRIVFKNEIGGVSVLIPIPECGLSLEQIAEKDLPINTEYTIVTASELLQIDDNFFDAWEMVNGKIDINFEKAKELTKKRLRIERAPLLATQDIAFQRALETGANTDFIIAEKQRLRDVTNLVDDCISLDQLRAIKC